MTQLHPYARARELGRPLVLGHRGASARARDNSAAAFRLAVAQGADGVELDVRRTADGSMVIHHDPEIPGVGVVVSRTLDEIKSADAEVVTLEEAIGILDSVLVNIEIKNDPAEPDFDPEHRLANLVVEWITAHNREPQVVISSFNPRTVARIIELDPAIPTGQLVVPGIDLADIVDWAAAMGIDAIHPGAASLADDPAEIVQRCHGAGLDVAVWTVDEPTEIQRLAAAGVDAIITNDPARALESLAGA